MRTASFINSGLALQVMGTRGRLKKFNNHRKFKAGNAFRAPVKTAVKSMTLAITRRAETLWTVTGGGINITFDEDGKRAHGTLQKNIGKHLQQTLEVFVSFDVRN